jgi:hypothetical protein
MRDRSEAKSVVAVSVLVIVPFRCDASGDASARWVMLRMVTQPFWLHVRTVTLMLRDGL